MRPLAQAAQAAYLGGGSSIGAFVEQHWVPHMSAKQTLEKAKQYVRGRK